jgi:hypothetical protein
MYFSSSHILCAWSSLLLCFWKNSCIDNLPVCRFAQRRAWAHIPRWLESDIYRCLPKKPGGPALQTANKLKTARQYIYRLKRSVSVEAWNVCNASSDKGVLGMRNYRASRLPEKVLRCASGLRLDARNWRGVMRVKARAHKKIFYALNKITGGLAHSLKNFCFFAHKLDCPLLSSIAHNYGNAQIGVTGTKRVLRTLCPPKPVCT